MLLPGELWLDAPLQFGAKHIWVGPMMAKFVWTRVLWVLMEICWPYYHIFLWLIPAPRVSSLSSEFPGPDKQVSYPLELDYSSPTNTVPIHKLFLSVIMILTELNSVHEIQALQSLKTQPETMQNSHTKSPRENFHGSRAWCLIIFRKKFIA